MSTDTSSSSATLKTTKRSHHEAKPPSFCVMCGAQEARLCDGCQSVSYCSKACQKEDWGLHKLLCKTVVGFMADRPSPNHCAGILFPDYAKDPQLVWVECHRSSNGGMLGELWDSELFLHEGMQASSYLDHNIRRFYMMPYREALQYRDTYLDDGSPDNLCIINITQSRRAHDFRGPHLLLPEASDNLCRDACMADLRLAVDHFMSYGTVPAQWAEPLRKVRGVVLTSGVDQTRFGWPAFMGTTVYSSDSIFSPDKPLLWQTALGPRLPREPSIPQHLGIPLLTEGCVPTKSFIDAPGKGDHINVPSWALHLELDTENDRLQLLRQEMAVGTVLVVRKDGKELTPRQLEALCAFLRQSRGHRSRGVSHRVRG